MTSVGCGVKLGRAGRGVFVAVGVREGTRVRVGCACDDGVRGVLVGTNKARGVLVGTATSVVWAETEFKRTSLPIKNAAPRISSVLRSKRWLENLRNHISKFEHPVKRQNALSITGALQLESQPYPTVARFFELALQDVR